MSVTQTKRIISLAAIGTIVATALLSAPAANAATTTPKTPTGLTAEQLPDWNGLQETILTGPLVTATAQNRTWIGTGTNGAQVPVTNVDPGATWSIPQLGDQGQVRVGDLCMTIYRDAFFNSGYTEVQFAECVGASEQDFVVLPGSKPNTFRIDSMVALREPMNDNDNYTLPVSANRATGNTVTLNGSTDFDLSRMQKAAAPVQQDPWSLWW